MKTTIDGQSTLSHFDKKSTEWSELYKRPHFRDRQNIFVENACNRLPEGAEILDFGCGTGRISLELAKRGYSITGVDGAKGMIKQAQKAASYLSLNNKNVQFSLIDPPSWKPSKQYDAIVCSSVLEYVPDDEKLLNLFSIALKPGGWLLISIPSKASAVGFIEDVVQKLRSKDRDVEFAQRRYNRTAFKNTLAQTGLICEKTINFEFPILSKIGIALSRLSVIGIMSLVIAKKQ